MSKEFYQTDFDVIKHIKCRTCGGETRLIKYAKTGKWFCVDKKPGVNTAEPYYVFHEHLTAKEAHGSGYKPPYVK